MKYMVIDNVVEHNYSGGPLLYNKSGNTRSVQQSWSDHDCKTRGMQIVGQF